jgi:hypothetical protein
MSLPLTETRIVSVRPLAAVAGGRVTIRGRGVGSVGGVVPEVRIGEVRAHVVYADPDAVTCLVPPGPEGGATPVRVSTAAGQTAFLAVGAPVATGVHQVDSPVFGDDGTLYLTYSGSRGDQSPVSIFRVSRDGFRESFVTGITNPTSMAVAPSGRLHVSSRFDGTVVAVEADGALEPVASELGVACGLAFDPDGTLYVGDRSGTIFRVSSEGQVTPFATLPPSVAAFHLAMAPAGDLYVTGPTLSTRDAVYRVDQGGSVTMVTRRFGRPQGLAFDGRGVLHVVDALAGASGVYRLRPDGEAEHVVAAPALVGLAFDQRGGAAVVSHDTAFRFDTLP